MLGVEMYPSLPLGHQRLGDCYYRERDVAPPRNPLCPSSCDAAAACSLPPRLLAPPQTPAAPHEATPVTQGNVKMELDNASLWKQFKSIGTEMIITKKGRRMFPQLRVKVSGLKPTLRYILLLDIVPADSFRYRFQEDSWQVVGGAEARLPDRVFIHPDSPATGEHWQNRTISFHRTKLTNNTLDAQGHIILHSLHHYQPRVHVIEARDMLMWVGARHTFTFPETQFITVTAYQNNKITELKINSNPFAKGFRENGMNNKRQREARQKRKIPSQQIDHLDDLDVESCDPGDPCDSTELLPPNPAFSIAGSALPLSESSFRFDENPPAFTGATVSSDEPMTLSQDYISSQMTHVTDVTDIPDPGTLEEGLQTTAQEDLQDALIDRSAQMNDLPSLGCPYADSSIHFTSLSSSESVSSCPAVPPPLQASSNQGPDNQPHGALPQPSLQCSPCSSSDHTSLPSSSYSSSLPQSSSSPPHLLQGPSYPSISPSSLPSQQLLPSSSSTAFLSPHTANQNTDTFSPPTPNTPSQSLHPPLHPLHASLPSHSATPCQNELAQAGVSHPSTPGLPHASNTAFPFPPLPTLGNGGPDASTSLYTHSSTPLSAFHFPEQQTADSTQVQPITPPSDPNNSATAFPFAPVSVLAPGANFPTPEPTPLPSQPSSDLAFPTSGLPGSGSNDPAGLSSATPDAVQRVPFLLGTSPPSSTSRVISGPAPTHSSPPLPPGPHPVQCHTAMATNPNQAPQTDLAQALSSLPPGSFAPPASLQPSFPTTFPVSSFPYIPPSSSSTPSHMLQTCAVIPSQPFHSLPLPPSASSLHPNTPLAPASYPQYPSSTPTGSFPSMPPNDMGAYPTAQFNPSAAYMAEMVLHPSISSYSSAPQALYPSMSSYPLRLLPSQDPHPSLHIPLRHIYRPQHSHSQGPYLDMGAGTVF